MLPTPPDEVSMRFLRYMIPWTILVFVFALQWHATDAIRGFTWDPGDYLRWSIIEWYTLACLAPAVFRLTVRFPIEPPRRLLYLPLHIVASFAFAAAAVFLGALVSSFTESSDFSQQLSQFLAKHVATAMITYWVLVTIQQARHFFREKNRRALQTVQLQSQLAQSRLQVLKMQLHPHFLFNTLHAIATLIREEAALAEDMLLRLSELLRAYLDNDRQEIALARELELLDLYLGIQGIRFRDRLTTHIDATRATLDAAVPSLILQPLVENAINHGIGKHTGNDCVEIAAFRDDEFLYLEVRNRNSTLDVAPDAAFSSGIGLSNSRLRLKELYGTAASIHLDALVPRGVVCRIRLPFRAIAAAVPDRAEAQAA
jgi:two-component system LytT family sensor kinase